MESEPTANHSSGHLRMRLQRLHDAAGRPSYQTLVRRAAGSTPPLKLSTASIGEWLTGVSVPSSAAVFAYVVSELQTWASARAAPGFVPQPLAQWERLRKAAWAERHSRRAGRPASGKRGAPETDLQAPEPVGTLLSMAGDPFTFDVHPAIALSPGRTEDVPTALPRFIERAHDRELQTVFAEALNRSSRFVVLVGGALTGKSRSLWEALHHLPADWRIWHPLAPSPTEGLLAGLPHVAPRTVVWLTDAEQYLLTPGSDEGERIAAQLRELLRDPRRSPTLVVATLWPHLWDSLTDDATSIARPAQAQLRALLSGRSIEVPSSFHGADLIALKTAARTDPRLAEAHERSADGRITQYLAGGPIHLERYKNADELARALIMAAMDLRRLGHSTLMPRALVTDAARGYLTGEQARGLAADWHKHPADYCTRSARGIPGLLSPTSVGTRETGQPAGDYFTLSTYLEHVGRSEREQIPVPEATWDALERHGADDTPTGRRRVATEALGRCLLRRGYRLFAASARLGDRGSTASAAHVLQSTGGPEQAKDCLIRFANEGDREAHLPLAAYILADGHIEEGLSHLRLAVTDDDPSLLSISSALALMRAARVSDLRVDDWLCDLVGAGNFAASMYVLAHGAEHGEQVRANMIELGSQFHPKVVAAYDEVLRSGSAHLDAVLRYETLARETNTAKINAAAAESKAISSRRALKTRDAFEAIMEMYGAPLADSTPEAAYAALAAAEHSEPFALTAYMHVVLSSGNTQDAARWMSEKAASGNTTAVEYASILHMLNGDYCAARAILEPHFGRTDMLIALQLELIPLGYSGIALDWLEYCSHFAPLWFRRAHADALRVVERYDEALQIYLRECEAASEGALAFNPPMVFHCAHATLLQARRAADADLLKIYGLEAGGRISSPWGIDG
jgi:hypothetical protein